MAICYSSTSEIAGLVDGTMNLSLSDEAERMIEERLRSGQYKSIEEVILAGLGSLEQQEQFGDFESAEWDLLLQEGEQSLADSGSITAQEVFAVTRQRLDKSAS